MNKTDNEKLSYLTKIIKEVESMDFYRREEALGYVEELQKKTIFPSTLPLDHFYYTVDLWHDGVKHVLDIRGFRSPETSGIEYMWLLNKVEIGGGSEWRAGQYGFAGETEVEYKVLVAEVLDKAKQHLNKEKGDG